MEQMKISTVFAYCSMCLKKQRKADIIMSSQTRSSWYMGTDTSIHVSPSRGSVFPLSVLCVCSVIYSISGSQLRPAAAVSWPRPPRHDMKETPGAESMEMAGGG